LKIDWTSAAQVDDLEGVPAGIRQSSTPHSVKAVRFLEVDLEDFIV
jgi:hypothetical protein